VGRYRTSLILLLVLLALAGAVYFLQLRSGSTTSPEDQAKQIVKVAEKDVIGLLVVLGDKRVDVARQDDKWVLREPSGREADQARIDVMVSRVADLRASRVVVEKAESLATYGLDKPSILLRLSSRDQTYEVTFGQQNPDKTGYYARLGQSDRVYLVSSYLVGDIRRLAEDPPIARPTPTPEPTLPVPTPLPSPTPTATPGP
jgi:hypothetical protein